jgi:hypothetical protein
MDSGVHHITAKKWDDWIYNAPKDGKPWLINFCNTMMNTHDSDQLCNRAIQQSACLAEALKGDFNVGFIDYRGGEMVLESYDWGWGRWWRMAPLQIIIEKGTIYQLPQKNYSILHMAEAVKAKEEHAVYITPVVHSRNDFNIYWEYATRDVGVKKYPFLMDRWIRNKLNI